MRKNGWLSLLRFLVQAGLLAGLMYLTGRVMSIHVIQLRFRWGTEGLVALGIALALGSWVLYRLLWHVGWLIGSLCSGYKLAEYSFLGFGLHRNEWGQLRLMRRRPAGRYVLALVTPPRMVGVSPYLPSLLGGPVLVAAASAVFGVLAAVIGHRPADMTLLAWITAGRANAVFLMTPCIWGVVTLVGHCIPVGDRRDLPTLIRSYASSADLRRVREQLMHHNALLRRGVFVRKYPEEFFVPVPEELLDRPQAYTVAAVQATRMICDNEFSEAYDRICRLLEQPAPDHAVRCLLIADAAYLEAIMEKEPVHVPMLDDPTLQLFLGEHSLELLRAQYAAAAMVHQNDEAAAAFLARYNAEIGKLNEYVAFYEKGLRNRVMWSGWIDLDEVNERLERVLKDEED